MNEKFYMSVMELINAYEKALILSINNKQTETTPKILMMNQVITMEAAVETGELGFGLSVAEIAKQIKEEKTNDKVYSAVNSGKKKNFFTECYIDGQLVTDDSSILANKFKSQMEIDFGDMYSANPKSTPKLNMQYKATNDFKYRLDYLKNKNISKYLDENMASFDSNGDGIPDKVNLFGWKTNFGLEKCLDCFLDLKLELYIPSLEWAFDFSKILGKIKNFLGKMNAALDPKGPMIGICALLEALKNNGVCPKNLPPLALLLPSLFAKYSFDLLNIRLNLSGLFLPLIKTVLGALVATIENIPRIINPIFNCLINTFVGINYLIKNYLSLGDQLINNITSAGDALLGVPRNLKNTFAPGSDSFLDFSKETNKKTFDKVDESLNAIDDAYNNKDKKLTYKQRAQVMLTELLKLHEQRAIKVYSLNAGEHPKANYYMISPTDYIKLDDYLNFTANNQVIANSTIIRDKQKLLDDLAKLKRNSEVLKATTTPVKRGSAVSKIESINTLNKKIKESTDPFLATYGLENKVQYVPDKEPLYKASMLKSYVSKEEGSKNPINEFFEGVILKLKEYKQYVNDFVGGIVNAVKSLTVFISETLDMDIQITGSILELLHLIRFVRLLWNLIKNGLDDCSKFKQNPQLVNNIIKNVYNSNYDTVVNNPLNPSLNNPSGAFKEYLTITDTKTGKKMHIDPDECNSISSLNLSDAILDNIHSDLMKTFFTQG